MKPNRNRHSAQCIVSSLVLAGAAVASQPVPVANAGFESQAVNDGNITSGNVSGWTAFNGASIGVLDPSSAADLTSEAPEGENVGLVVSNASENGLSQLLGSPFQADASYSLTVKVANTKFTAGFPGYGIQLLANGTVLAEDNNSQTISEDSVATCTVNYTYNAGLHSGLVGQPLEIRLLSKGLQSLEEVAFDDVQLSAILANPSANPGGPYSVDHEASLSLDGSGSLPSDGQTITTYTWDLDGDGDFDENVTGATPAAINHATLIATPPAGYGMELGTNTIRLRVTDSSAKTSTTEGTVTLLPPVSKFTPSTVRPLFNEQDQGYFNDPLPSTAGSPGDKWFAEVSGAGQTKGQSFTITGDRILKGITYRIATDATPTKVYVIRINALDPATNTLYPIHTEEITQLDDWGVGNTDAYGTWSFGAPVTLRGLPGGTVYSFDIAMKSSTSAWQTGIPYPTYMNTDVVAGGYKYTCAQTGTMGSATTTVIPDSGRDREFHADMETTTFTDTVTPTLTGVTDQVGGGPIYQDQVQVAYLLTFDDAVDATTIDLADFENLGSGVSINSVVSATHTIPYPIASAVRVVLGVSGTGTLRLGVKPSASITDHAGNAITVPFQDDVTITVNAGANPGSGNRWWDGTVTTGVTNGVSSGGTATWNTTTTNWDRGFGFAAPVAWSNTNLATAIFGGTTGTVTLGAGIVAGGITTAHTSGTYTISGANTLTFDVNTGTPVVDVPANTLAISSTLAGTKGLQKNGAGTLQLTGTNNISGGLTLNAGTLTVTNSASAFGTGTLTINGGTIQANTNGQISTTTNDHVWNGNFTLGRGPTNNGNATWNFNGNILLGANVTVTHSANTAITALNGTISDSGGNLQLTLAANSSGIVTLSGSNTHGGGTRINSGTLRINHASALGTGTFTIGGASTIDNVTGGPLTLAAVSANVWNNNLTFTGTHDLNLGNGPLTLSNNSTVTVSAGTLTVGGGIGQSGANRALTKAGAGTLALLGANTYAGNTTVNAGTLVLNGNSHNSAIIMNSGTILTLTLGNPMTSTKTLTLNAGSIIRLIGTPSGPTTTYPLFATAGITGTPVIETPIPGYDLVVINDDELRLVQTGSDLTPPTLTSIVDDKGGTTIMSGTTVTYTVTLNEDMDDTSVSAADFGNAGTALITIGSVIETSPGVFSVEVTPTSGGTLQFQVKLGAVLKDLAGINLVTASALPDDTIITVEAMGYEDWATGGELFDEDSNGDGVDNGVAFLLGANDPYENVLNRLPAAARDSAGNLVLTFNCLPDEDRGNATLYVEHSNDLGGSDPWASSAAVTDTAGGPPVNGVTLSVIPGFPLNSVSATINAAEAGGTGKLYGRLRAENPANP